ncbi:hypothetical protein IX317_000357 [Fusobacterium sp. DD29]|uniref:penicillin-binding protein n=1 Tax=unclassified Fusobacterium TaxID=2648384 RepID=UPI001B8CB209|nr:MULTISPECIES: penicillin-binding protein [unclassified Fusobacterium]MBR8748698.1 hypothetical protein [Fusobacterium sp. DD29]MBR8760950.1 hypothetical protein [Fusobacterium sp. DD25]MBR8766977.1 hypothetical protein [Fusobacterium sp. DD43]MBR8770978.1 hypothetical protein [Fusobacterium sp. DD40]MBR8775253.1 hypothetical protein [Fusobacterium sp. DD17]
MIFYYDKEKAKSGQLFLLGQEDVELTEKQMQEQGKEIYKQCVIYKGESPLSGYPVIDKGELRAATDRELIDMGLKTLGVGEVLSGDYILGVEKPNPYSVWDGTKWVEDAELKKDYYFNLIDTYKKECLEYGFDYNGHQQRCRDKDVAFMVATVVALLISRLIKKQEKSVPWYFEDNHGETMGLDEMAMLMAYGTTFIQSVYDTENYFKTIEKIEMIDSATFEDKRKEIHKKLAGEE